MDDLGRVVEKVIIQEVPVEKVKNHACKFFFCGSHVCMYVCMYVYALLLFAVILCAYKHERCSTHLLF
jgi:hypothetical protein